VRNNLAKRLLQFDREGGELKVRVNGQLTFNTSDHVVDAALAGLGDHEAFSAPGIVRNNLAKRLLPCAVSGRLASLSYLYQSYRQVARPHQTISHDTRCRKRLMIWRSISVLICAWFAPAGFMSGNSIALKHAYETTFSDVWAEFLFR
jgi:hypothetical protein